MNRSFKTILLFSIVVTLGMNALDIFFHYGTDTAVHLNYVLIKLTIIFLTTYLISQFTNISAREGVLVSVLGPFFFWLYYVYAYPTLDRTVFRFDDQFIFMFWHIAMMLIAYFASYWYMTKESYVWRRLTFIITATFSLLALEILYFMVSIKLAGFPEEEEVKMITFPDSYTMFAIIAAPIALISWTKLNHTLQGLIAGLISAVAAYFLISEPLMNTGLMHAVYLFIMVNIVYTFIKGYGNALA